jgi:beta-glucosidase/6-phospho-beta-glucosidase/beta-galactosidase
VLFSQHPEQRFDRTSAILCIAVTKPASYTELPIFQSFLMGGFECATHRRRDRSRIDVLTRTKHDLYCAMDYRMLAQAGIRTVRDGLRWHLIESLPGTYDWSSFLPMLHAAHATGTQVIWDLCHWGIPDWLDVFSDEFILHFTNFSIAAATLIRDAREQAGCTDPPFYAPINEISFWAWVGGDEQHFHPFASARGPELKKQLVRASIAAIRAVRVIQPDARFVQPEPLIHISVNPRDTTRDQVADAVAAAAHTAAQFDTWDMLCGVRDPELGGSPDLLDIVGVNYYWNNQWTHAGPPTPAGHLEHRALHIMLHDLSLRYQRPVLITETGAEAGAGAGWLGYIGTEVRQAQRLGASVVGICLYPVMDYPGWDDDRHCRCGLIETSLDWSTRRLRDDLLPELELQQGLFGRSVDLVAR